MESWFDDLKMGSTLEREVLLHFNLNTDRTVHRKKKVDRKRQNLEYKGLKFPYKFAS